MFCDLEDDFVFLNEPRYAKHFPKGRREGHEEKREVKKEVIFCNINH